MLVLKREELMSTIVAKTHSPVLLVDDDSLLIAATVFHLLTQLLYPNEVLFLFCKGPHPFCGSVEEENKA